MQDACVRPGNLTVHRSRGHSGGFENFEGLIGEIESVLGNYHATHTINDAAERSQTVRYHPILISDRAERSDLIARGDASEVPWRRRRSRPVYRDIFWPEMTSIETWLHVTRKERTSPILVRDDSA